MRVAHIMKLVKKEVQEMKGNPVVRDVLAEFKENELIIASKLYREKLVNRISEAAYYKTLQRMCESGELVKIAKGTYHLPKVSKYGIVPPSEQEIISAFTENETGTVIGYALYNSLNLTTQISKSVTVMSSALEGFSKTIRNVVVHRVDIDYTESVINMIHCLEVLQNFDRIQDINYSVFIKYIEEFSKTYTDRTFEEVFSNVSYKKSTISFLREILNYYKVDNDLDKHLSSLSNYKHPSVKEIYQMSLMS